MKYKKRIVYICGRSPSEWFAELEEPDRSNLINSITPIYRDRVCYSLIAAILLIEWNFCPEWYYKHLLIKYSK